MLGVSPKFETNATHYSMNCSRKSPGGLKRPPRPGKPKSGARSLKIQRSTH